VLAGHKVRGEIGRIASACRVHIIRIVKFNTVMISEVFSSSPSRKPRYCFFASWKSAFQIIIMMYTKMQIHLLRGSEVAMAKRTLRGVMLICEMFKKFLGAREPLAVVNAGSNWAAMWMAVLVSSHEMRLKFFDSLERILHRTSMNIALERLDNTHEIGMPILDVIVELIFTRKSERATTATGIRTLELAFPGMNGVRMAS
jgi:hypothetical protein